MQKAILVMLFNNMRCTYHQRVWGPPSIAIRVSGCAAMSRVAMSKELVKEKIELAALMPCSTRRGSSESGLRPSAGKACAVNSPLVNHLTSLRRGILYDERCRRKEENSVQWMSEIHPSISIL
jgi:hypothetical protein